MQTFTQTTQLPSSGSVKLLSGGQAPPRSQVSVTAKATTYAGSSSNSGAATASNPVKTQPRQNNVNATVMQNNILTAPQTLPVYTPDDVFVCPEESLFYSQCLEKLVISRPDAPLSIIEFGSGDGSPILNCLVKTPYAGTIHGYELNPSAARIANHRIGQFRLSNRYQVHNSCFFKGAKQTPAGCLIANPPYIPAPDNNILMPALHGGVDGANLTRELMSLGFDSTLLMISAYSNPVETIQHAQQEGYKVTDFLITPLPFGYYSSEPKVRSWIAKMRDEGKAFYSDHCYFLGGVLFEKNKPEAADLSDELLKVLTAL